jgi:Fe-S cluster assembly protein SufD
MAAVPIPDAFVASFERAVRPLVSAEPGWLVKLRDDAIERFAALGFPTRRMEEWRSTSVAGIAETEFRLAAADGGEISLELLARLVFEGAHRLVFVNGHLSDELSTPGELPGGVLLTSLARAVEAHGELLERHLARHARFAEQAFVALNTAFFRDGAFLHLPRGVVLEHPVHLLYLATAGDEPLAAYPRTLVVAEEASQAAVVETFAGPPTGVYLSSPVTRWSTTSASSARGPTPSTSRPSRFSRAAARASRLTRSRSALTSPASTSITSWPVKAAAPCSTGSTSSTASSTPTPT